MERRFLMNSKLTSLAIAGLFALTLSACATAPGKTAQVSKESTTPAISAEAQQALTQAEADIKLAKSKYALWTTAQSSLDAAEQAAKAGDSATVLKQAKLASDLAQLGIGQLSYPSTER
jgi:flagellar basal body L-ring protein FlgH